MKVTKVLYMLWVTDMDRAVAFYSDVIGLYVHTQSPSWSELTLGDSAVALHQGSNDSFRMTGLSFEVDDIDEACREIASAGGSIVHAPHDGGIPGLRLADVADPDGNRIQLGKHGD